MNPVTKLGSSSFCIYETTFLNLKVKYADVEGTNMYHVKSFVDSYNAANEEPIVEFRHFLEYEGISEYLCCFYEIGRAGISGAGSIQTKTKQSVLIVRVRIRTLTFYFVIILL